MLLRTKPRILLCALLGLAVSKCPSDGSLRLAPRSEALPVTVRRVLHFRIA